MTYYGADDLTTLMEDMGETVTFSGDTATGLIDDRTIDVVAEGFGVVKQEHQTIVTLRRSDFSSLAVNDTVTARSTTYRVRAINPIGDGALKEVILVES